jgi:hypothetical protein
MCIICATLPARFWSVTTIISESVYVRWTLPLDNVMCLTLQVSLWVVMNRASLEGGRQWQENGYNYVRNFMIGTLGTRVYSVFLTLLHRWAPAERSASVALYAAWLGGFSHLTTKARQMLAVMITFEKSSKNSLECWTGAYRSSREKTPHIWVIISRQMRWVGHVQAEM